MPVRISKPPLSPPLRPLRAGETLALAATAAFVVLLLAWLGGRHDAEFDPPPAAAQHYNLLAEGFRSGQLHLRREIPPGLAQLPDPYDPAANAPYRAPPFNLHDASFYRGRLYLYFGPVPAVVLFWPYRAITGAFLSERSGVVIFSILAFLASSGLVVSLWRRYFPALGVAIACAGVLGVGLATGVPVMLQRPSFYEVPITAGCALICLCLLFGWRAVHCPQRSGRWLAAASLAYGLALGCRPSLLFGAAMLPLFVIAIAGCRPAFSRSALRLWLAALGPLFAVGLLLLLYNQLRFGNPFEFGQRYQLAGDRQAEVEHFRPRYLGVNLQLYFLEPMRWTRSFPFVDEPAAPALPAGHADVVEFPLAILTNLPLVWLAFAAPLALRRREEDSRLRLGWFFLAPAAWFVTSAGVIALFYTTSIRYEIEFLPPLIWLAVAGIFGLEQFLSAQGRWRRGVRAVWIATLACSIGLSLLATASRFAEKCYGAAALALQAGQTDLAVAQFGRALEFKPAFARAHADLAIALTRQQRLADALAHLREAVRLDPSAVAARVNLATLCAMVGRLPEAISEFREVLRRDPDNVDAHVNLGTALLDSHQPAEAGEHFRAALRLRPDDPAARAGLQEAEAGARGP